MAKLIGKTPYWRMQAVGKAGLRVKRPVDAGLRRPLISEL
jgi:hypothetical protein